eukprot:1181124-Prorocentrum_minimum.AAC.5
MSAEKHPNNSTVPFAFGFARPHSHSAPENQRFPFAFGFVKIPFGGPRESRPLHISKQDHQFVFLDVARSRSDARPDFRSGRAKRAPGSPWEAIPRRGVPAGKEAAQRQGKVCC